MATLQEALDSLPDPSPFPQILPLTHLTEARAFTRIAETGLLETRYCRIFNRNLAYLFYGGVFFRGLRLPTNVASCYPVAFVFRPQITIDGCYYPFDTGAMHAGKFAPADEPLQPFRERMRLRGSPAPNQAAKFIHYCFGGNEPYVRGRDPRNWPDCGAYPEALRSYRRFLATEISDPEVDFRRRAVEVQVDVPRGLRDLDWIAIPNGFEKDLARLCVAIGWVPPFYIYEAFSESVPAELAGHLQQQAYAQVIRRYLDVERVSHGE